MNCISTALFILATLKSLLSFQAWNLILNMSVKVCMKKSCLKHLERMVCKLKQLFLGRNIFHIYSEVMLSWLIYYSKRKGDYKFSHFLQSLFHKFKYNDINFNKLLWLKNYMLRFCTNLKFKYIVCVYINFKKLIRLKNKLFN